MSRNPRSKAILIAFRILSRNVKVILLKVNNKCTKASNCLHRSIEHSLTMNCHARAHDKHSLLASSAMLNYVSHFSSNRWVYDRWIWVSQYTFFLHYREISSSPSNFTASQFYDSKIWADNLLVKQILTCYLSNIQM